MIIYFTLTNRVRERLFQFVHYSPIPQRICFFIIIFIIHFEYYYTITPELHILTCIVHMVDMEGTKTNKFFLFFFCFLLWPHFFLTSYEILVTYYYFAFFGEFFSSSFKFIALCLSPFFNAERINRKLMTNCGSKVDKDVM